MLYVATSDGTLHAWSSGVDTQLIVTSNGALVGNPFPFVYGTNHVITGSRVAASVPASTPAQNGYRHFVTGWTGTGSVPASGNSNHVEFVLQQLSTLRWNWVTQCFLSSISVSNGTVQVSDSWFDFGSLATLTAVPSQYFHFARWAGDASGTNPVVSLVMDRPRSAIA